ncbi:MAG TPA: dihydrolipoyl dehydrogenase [Ignavibacteria bacterium]|nr:dihydrolipoyl dehydrogenase [Ignavibacteria bacterium]
MSEYDVVIIGGGPGGYTAAIRAAQLGFKVAVVESARLGGICLNWGCIPSKSLLKAAEVMHTLKKSKEFGITSENIKFDFQAVIKRSRDVADKSEKGVQYLFKKNKVTYISGWGKIRKGTDGTNTVIAEKDGQVIDEIKTKHIIIATGSKARSFPGMKIDGKKVLSFMEAIVLDKLPETVTIIGAGAIGIEFAYFWNAFGSKVTVVEMLDQPLPQEDKEITDVVGREFRKLGITIMTGTKVEEIKVEKTAPNSKTEIVKTKISGKKNEVIESDIALVAVGFAGNVENMGLEELGVTVDKGFIKVDKDYKSNISGIYAIGDVNGPPWLAHVASAEGVNCVEKIKGMEVPDIDYTCIPGVTFCQPQVASVGLTEKKAKELGYEVKVGKFPFSASGKARAIGETAGLVKVIFDAKYDELIGAHVCGSEASEMIAELTLGKSLETTHEQIIRTIHAHPTLAEATMEAVADAYGEAINI